MDFLKPDKISNTRALLCYAIGVAVGLVLGGIGLFNAKGTTTNTVPEEDIALVNRQPILRSDFVAQLEAETGKDFADTTDEEQLRVLDEMLREELFVQRGLELNFAETDQDTRYALYAIVEAQILAGVSTAQPTEQQLREFYESHRDLFKSTGSLDVHHLVFGRDEQDQAQAVAQALRDGMPLAQAKQQFGVVEGEYFGKEFYYLASYHLGEGLFDEVSTHPAGDVVGPVLAEGNYHVVQVLANDLPQPLSFEDAGSEVKTKYYNVEKAERMNNMLDFLRNRSTILITDEYRDGYDPADFEEQAGS